VGQSDLLEHSCVDVTQKKDGQKSSHEIKNNDNSPKIRNVLKVWGEKKGLVLFTSIASPKNELEREREKSM